MQWLETLDVDVFRFLNGDLSNPVLDALMPILSGSHSALRWFWPLLFLAAILLMWKGKTRGVVCVLMVALAVGFGDGIICKSLKEVLGRQRPFLVLPDVHLLVGKGGSGSMPSSHAANWFAAAMTLFIYYRRSAFFMVPAALLVSLS